MKKIVFTIALGLGLLTANAQIQELSGPRIGVTFISSGTAADFVHEGISSLDNEANQIGKTGSATITQYGWQWESRFADGGNVTGIVEWIALVGGMEKGYFLPSVSSMVGLRTDKGLEFAVGPNLSFGGIAMVFGAGYNFKFGKLNVPVNIAYVPSMNKTYNHEEKYDYVELYDEDGNDIGYEVVTPKYSVIHPTGARISVMLGFNLSK